MALTFAHPPYSRRDVPSKYDRAWLGTELGNLQRAFLPSTVKHVTTVSYTPNVRDSVILANATTNPVTIILPQPSRVHGLTLWIKRIDNVLANAVTLLGTVDGAANPTLTTQYAAIQIVADETGWWRLARTP